jgi:tetratricopeptide (TPR) repeat protein
LVQSTPGLGAAAAARARWVAGCALAACGKDAEARAQFEASLAHAREVGDRHCECRSLIDVAARESHGGHMDTARAHLQAALAAASDIEDRTLQCDARKELGIMEVMLGRSNEAQAQFEQARALAREAGDREREGFILANLGILHVNAGRMDEARADDEAALALALELGNRKLEGNIRSNLGLLHQQGKGVAQDSATAVAYYRKAVALGHPAGMHNLAWMLDSGQGVPRKEPEEAADLMMKSLDRRHEFSVKQMKENPRPWSKEFRQALQRKLRDAGVYSGPTDGEFKDTTSAAIDGYVNRTR